MWGIFSGLQAAVPISIKKSDVQISCALFSAGDTRAIAPLRV